MKKFTFIFSLFIAMFTTAMAQESVNFSEGEFKGTAGDKSSWSQYVSANGVTIIATDANGNEVAAMREFSGNLRLYILENVKTPIKFSITVPENYKLSEMKFMNGSKNYNMALDYDLRTYNLTGNTDAHTITFTEDNTFKLYGNEGLYINITSLTMTKVGGNEGEGENGGNEGEGENGGNEGEGENGGNEGEGENGGNEGEGENGGNEGEGENGGNEGEGENGDNANSINEVSVEAEQVIYDLTGRRVEKITKAGIYIINGKKVIK